MQTPRVLLLLSNGFEALEAGYFTDVLGWSSENNGPNIDIVTCGLHPLLKCTWGLTVKPDLMISEVDVTAYDALAIPGGFEEAGFYKDAYSGQFTDVIRKFNESGKTIASICVGSLALGKAEVLRGRKATTYQLNGIRMQQLSDFGVNISNENIVVDGNIITCASPAEGLCVAFLLLRRLTSRDNMLKVGHLMGFNESICQKVSQL